MSSRHLKARLIRWQAKTIKKRANAPARRKSVSRLLKVGKINKECLKRLIFGLNNQPSKSAKILQKFQGYQVRGH